MDEQPDNLVLTGLRRLDAKFDRMAEDIRDLKVRMTAVGEGLAGVHRRMDRFESRLERIERRPDLVEAPH